MTTRLPDGFPTHQHSGAFWEALGRTVATFGYLEETLAKAIFAFSSEQHFPDVEVGNRFEVWLPQFMKDVTETLPTLIDRYQVAVRQNQRVDFFGFDVAIDQMRGVVQLRNALCHASWKAPDAEGRSFPFFISRNGKMLDRSIDVAFLEQTQRATADMARVVIETVVHMGWQFPGIKSPGVPLL